MKKMFKRALAGITVLSMLAATGCASTSTASTDTATADAAESKGAIGFINHDLNDPFQQYMLLGGQETAAKLGYEFFSGSAENDPLQEQDLIKTFASRGVSLLVLGSTTKESGEAAIELAHEYGMKVVTMDSIQDDSLADSQVGGDDVAAGYIAGIELAEAMGGEGEVAICKYPSEIPPSEDRVEGFYLAFEEYPGITVIAEDGPDADQISAQTWATDIMQAHPDVKGFISIMDAHGIGIVRGVENVGKEDSVAVVTVVESQDSYKELQVEGTPLKAVVAMHSYNYGSLSVNLLDEMNCNRPAPSILKTTGVAVTVDNVEEYMDLIIAQTEASK
ncbi:sugar ABC transporter substrate-binding protein [Chakrabartyella piscis]|uniref:sugar ABC transporter substrate-binding protein n=1 Tax=Chakrabartyella piscis TaxID=2918914 RepID=UPI00295843E0|nr:sugar ABC transporter substrate-binding protein [Chakrabartyella piscis]